MSWHRPNIGSRVTREGHARFWERPEVKFLRATRQVLNSQAGTRFDFNCSNSQKPYHARGRLHRSSRSVLAPAPGNHASNASRGLIREDEMAKAPEPTQRRHVREKATSTTWCMTCTSLRLMPNI